MKKTCVIFDCDGVLVDSEKLTTRLLIEFVKPMGVSMSHEEAMRRFKGGKMADHVKQLEKIAGRVFPEDFVSRFRKQMVSVFKAELEPVQGIVNALENIRNTKCVASSGPPEKIFLSLGITGLMDYFDECVFSGYTINSWKPEPDLFLYAAAEMGFDPANCVVIEDSEIGVQAGVAAGMKVLGYCDDPNDKTLENEGAYRIFNDMHLLPQLIEDVT